jgi:hypothetical protein
MVNRKIGTNPEMQKEMHLWPKAQKGLLDENCKKSLSSLALKKIETKE